MQQELSQLQAQIAALQAENESLKLEKHQLEEQNQKLKEQNHQRKQDNQKRKHELNNVVVAPVLDYEAVRDRILKDLTTGKGSFSRTSPQFRAASRALDRFVEAITSTPTPLINQDSN